MSYGSMAMRGSMSAKVIRAEKAPLVWKLSNFVNVWSGLWRHALASILKMNHMLGSLYVRVIKPDGKVINYGLVSTKLVTTAFVNFVVDQLQTETSVFGDFKYHQSGTGTTDPNVSDTDTETAVGSKEAGTQTEGSSANIYKSVATCSYSGSSAITEHTLTNNGSNATGTLMDRHEFTAINVEDGDSIEFTYELTVSAGG